MTEVHRVTGAKASYATGGNSPSETCPCCGRDGWDGRRPTRQPMSPETAAATQRLLEQRMQDPEFRERVERTKREAQVWRPPC